MSTTTKNTRRDLEGRLSTLEARMTTRRDDITDIESRQLAAATGGESPDQALATAKGVLLDAAGIDDRAAAALRGQIDQLLAAEQRERDVAELDRLRAEMSAAVTAAQSAAAAWPGRWQAAHDAVKVALRGLVDAYAEVVGLDQSAAHLAGIAGELAGRLGEDGPTVTSEEGQLQAVVITYPSWVGRTDLTQASGRLFAAVKEGDVHEAAKQLALAAYPPAHIAMPTLGHTSNPYQQMQMEAEHRQTVQQYDQLMQQLGRQQ